MVLQKKNHINKGGNEMTRKVTVAAGQLGPNSDNREEIVQRMIKLLTEGKQKGINIICYPEWSLSPYAFTTQILQGARETFFDQIPNELTKPLFQKAKEYGIAMIIPYAEKDGSHFYNSSIVVNEDGEILGKYRKNHIPLTIFATGSGKASYEKLYFEPGNLGYPTFILKTAHAKIGVQICYDRRFPEGSRILALKGAEIIFMPHNFATYEEKGRAGTWGRIKQARALENMLFIVAPNKAGTERGRFNVGRSLIIECENGDIIAEGKNEGDELVYATIDLDKVAEVRSKRALTRDMRPELYRELFELYGLTSR
jgi:predicted amidohydrolase